MGSEINYNAPTKNIHEVRVNAEELAASFPESTRFDTPPSSLLNPKNQNANFESPTSETAFFPIEDTPTLEPITDSITSSEIREKEEMRINQSMLDLANMKLRAEVPYFKQQELETNLDELKSVLHQKEEHLKSMATNYRNLQRTYANRIKDYEQRISVLDKKNSSKETIIKVLCPIIFVLTIIPFFMGGKQVETSQPKEPLKAPSHQIVEYTTPETTKVIYTVKSKDTLSSISKKFYGDSKYASVILKNNNLNSNKLKVGSKLIITEVDEIDQ